MRQIANLIVGLLTCIVLWITLSGLLDAFIMFGVGAHMQSRSQIDLYILSGTPLLSIGALSGILIYRARPLLFGVMCAVAATASVVLCMPHPVLLKPVFLAKWALFFVFAIAGAYLGWWILRLRQRQNVTLKVWQSFVTFTIVFGILSLVSYMQTIVIRRKIFKPFVQALQTLKEEDIRELFESNVPSNAPLSEFGCRASPDLRVEVVDFGIYTGGVADVVVDAPQTATGSVIQHRDSILSEETSRVPAVLGIVFGFTYRIDGLQDDTPVPLRYRWTTPGVTPPGKPTRVQEEFHWGYTRGSKGGHILRFEEEWELVPGLWKLDVIHKERVLASKSFTVFSPEMDKSNKPSHHAVESLTGETFNGR